MKTAKQQAVEDIQEDLLQEHKVFIAFIEKLDPIMDQLVDQQIKVQEEKKYLNQDRIDNYLKGRLSENEEIEFLGDLMLDEELREQAYLTALLTKSLKDK